jgi:flavorubredoxin
MKPIALKDNIYWIGVNDYTTKYFEGIWPIEQEGVSYNSYLINDDKKAVIDLTKEILTDEFISQINQYANLSELDYVILNHMEPDHTGALQIIRQIAPKATIICTDKAKNMLEGFYGITENVHTIQPGETLSLGKTTLQFQPVPNVHWPETMVTYATESKILFTCDAFGGYGALRGAIFNDTTPDLDFFKTEALRYYVNIVSIFNKAVLKAIATIEKAGFAIDMIAPSHGLIWRENPTEIIDLYRQWAQYGTGDAAREKAITLVYGSMYGNTQKAMEAIVEGIHSENVHVNIFDALKVHPGYIMPSIYTRQGLIVGSPTYEGAMHPPVANLLHEIARKRFKDLTVARFGSYGWSGGAAREFTNLTDGLNWNVVDTLEFLGGASEETLKQAFEFGANFARTIKNG